jgi:hypothetical protein
MPLQANFSYSTTYSCLTSQVSATLNAPAQGGTRPYGYRWSYDGSPFETGAADVSHTFEPGQAPNVTLIGTDVINAEAVHSADLRVGYPPCAVSVGGFPSEVP